MIFNITRILSLRMKIWTDDLLIHLWQSTKGNHYESPLKKSSFGAEPSLTTAIVSYPNVTTEAVAIKHAIQ